ncbi:hypothetical protein IEO21_08384 [Rhodonia placenta]|uniref:F-box domain-containing protein n=1 Tax=Rhodonia placenta TaxID=104341 RepID=A0A8H7NWA7_9APHY|nr:hypothetical protein IEO21_08384 [Postia placenta]
MIWMTPSASAEMQLSRQVCAQRGSIHALPDDIMLLIIGFIEVKDILSIRKASKRFYTITKLRWVWHDAMKRHVIDRGLPVPAADADLKAFSAEHLEARAVHAARFHDNWCSSKPKATRKIEFRADRPLLDDLNYQNGTSVSQIFFLPGRNGEFLVTAVGRVITCWEVPLDGSGAYRVAEWVSSKKIDQLVMNEDPRHPVVLAYVSGDPNPQGAVELCALSLDTFHGCFHMRAKLRGHRANILPLHVCHGDYVIFGDPLIAWFTMSPSEIKTLGAYHSPTVQEGESDDILAVKVVNRYMVVVRQRSCAIDYAPSWNGKRITYSAMKMAVMAFDNIVSEAVIVVRNTTVKRADEPEPEWPSEPVTVLARCTYDGLDTLQQFDLLPQRYFPVVVTEDESGKPVNIFRFPCIFPPRFTRVVVTAPSCRGLYVTRSGKGFWIETRNVTSRHSVHPARCIVGFQVASNPESEAVMAEIRAAGVKQGCIPITEVGNGLEICRDALYARRCDMSEILWKKYSLACAALEDTVGRIAIGDRMGKVEVLDFA